MNTDNTNATNMGNMGEGLTAQDRLTDQVTQALQSDKLTAAHPIEVATQGSTVVMHGTVDSQEAKDRAEQLVRNVPGVIDVDNELVVGHGDSTLFGRPDDNAGDTGDTVIPAAGLAAAGPAAGTGVSGAGYAAPGAAAAAGAPLAAESVDEDNLDGDENA